MTGLELVPQTSIRVTVVPVRQCNTNASFVIIQMRRAGPNSLSLIPRDYAKTNHPCHFSFVPTNLHPVRTSTFLLDRNASPQPASLFPLFSDDPNKSAVRRLAVLTRYYFYWQRPGANPRKGERRPFLPAGACICQLEQTIHTNEHNSYLPFTRLIKSTNGSVWKRTLLVVSY